MSLHKTIAVLLGIEIAKKEKKKMLCGIFCLIIERALGIVLILALHEQQKEKQIIINFQQVF